MARKIPPPPLSPEAAKERQQRTTDGDQPRPFAVNRQAEEERRDIVVPLTPPSSSPSPSPPSSRENGARPRTPSFSRQEELRLARRRSLQTRERRRRLDSLNLETGMGEPIEDNHDGRERNHFFENWLPQSSSLGFGAPSPPVQRHETETEGQELYLHFVHEQLRLADLDVSEEAAGLNVYHDPSYHRQQDEENESRMRRRRRESMNLSNFENPLWRQAGRDLKALAEQFARSRERDQVRRRAAAVQISSINMEGFFELLQGLFQDGDVTRERILVLFFFCSDLAIVAVRSGLTSLLPQLTQWTLTFIKDRVCGWVHRHGGWQSVLRTGMNLVQQVAIITTCAVVIATCWICVRRSR